MSGSDLRAEILQASELSESICSQISCLNFFLPFVLELFFSALVTGGIIQAVTVLLLHQNLKDRKRLRFLVRKSSQNSVLIT